MKSRFLRQVNFNLELFEQPWVRSLFLEFCASPFLPAQKLDITSRVDRHAVFFHKLEHHFSSTTEIDQEALLGIFSVDELRRNQLVVRFLVERLHLSWEMYVLKMHSEQRFIEQSLAQWNSESWIADLKLYASTLLNRTPRLLGLGTIRNYLNAAGRLLKSSESQRACDLNQEALKRYLKQSAGNRASLAAFLGFLRSQYSVDLQLSKKPVSNLESLASRTFRDLRQYTKQLRTTESVAQRRALIAALVSKLYQVPLKDVLLVKKADVTILEGEMTLHISGLKLLLDPRVGELLRPLCNQAEKFIFPGRNSFQSLSHSAVGYVLKRNREI